MKRTIAFLFSIAVCLMGLSAYAEQWQYVTKDNVNLRAGASQNAKVVGKAHLGMVVSPVAEEGTWTKVKTLSGNEMYVSSQFLAPLPMDELKAEYCVISKETRDNAQYEIGYDQFTSDGTSEVSIKWIIMAEDNSGKVMAERDYTYADTSGRARASQNFYTGKMCGWYVELTDETDGDFKDPQKLETPIYIYQLYSPKTCIYVNDEYFEGYSDDDWGD